MVRERAVRKGAVTPRCRVRGQVEPGKNRFLTQTVSELAVHQEKRMDIQSCFPVPESLARTRFFFSIAARDARSTPCFISSKSRFSVSTSFFTGV